MLLGAVLLGAGLAPGCGPGAPAPAATGVLVIALDGLRADHVGHLGHDRDTTPTIDGLAKEGVSFAQAFAASPQLLPAHVSLLTGCDPNIARRSMFDDLAAPPERRWHVPDEVPRLAVEFLAHGYATAAFVDHPDVAPIYGFAAGFQEYVESGGEPAPEAGPLDARLLQWLRGVDRGRPWFAYLELHDLERSWTHPWAECDHFYERRPGMDEIPPVASTDASFFAIPRSRWRGGARSLGHYEAIYDGRLHCLDARLAALLAELEVAGRLEEATVVVVGSYGMQFGEAGLYLASGAYSMADLHVPLVVRPARSLGVEAGLLGRRSERLVSLVDLAPSLLELHGLEPPPGTHGVSFADELRGPAAGSERAQRRFAIASCGLQEGCAVISERHCLEYLLPDSAVDPALERSWFGRDVEEPRLRVRFYDRIADPFPPLEGPVREEGPRFHELRTAAARWIDHISRARQVLQSSPSQRRDIDPALVQELRELGYLGDLDRGRGR